MAQRGNFSITWTLKGDFVLIQFGHNDGGPMDTGRARASIKVNGNETKETPPK